MTDLRTAAQQALEALKWSTEYRTGCATHIDVYEDLRAALAEPVQEPVAWQWLDTAHFRKKIPADATPAHWRPLYTAPPQRKPLTEEDLRDLADEHLFYQPEGYEVSGVFTFARAIERAHGIT